MHVLPPAPLSAYSDLVAHLYRAVLEPAELGVAMRRIDTWLGVDSSYLVGWDTTRRVPRMQVVNEQGGLDHVDPEYVQHYSLIDPRRQRLDEEPMGRLMTCLRHFDDRYVQRSEFFQKFLLPRGRRYSMGAHLHQDERFNFYLAFYHAVGREPFADEQVERAQSLVPHFTQLARLMVQHEGLRMASHVGERALDALDPGLFVLDASLDLVFANRRGEALLRDGQWLRSQGGRLRPGHGLAGTLDALLSQVAATGQPGSLVLRRPAALGEDTASWCGLTALALPPGTGSALSTLFAPARVLLIASQPDTQRSVTAQQLMQLFGLTQAEARLAQALVRGQSVDDYADTQGLALPTVRSQVRAVLAKTEAPRQQDLVRMLAQLPSARTPVGH